MKIHISKEISLQSITPKNCEQLYCLMVAIYPTAYQHFWKDAGTWYVKSQYSKEQIEKELLATNAEYYFVLFKGEIIGNFRIVWDEKLAGISEEKQVKLHRIYLHQNTQGKGIGKALLSWLEEKALAKGYTMIWLDAMDEKPQTFAFYKRLGYQYHSHEYLPFELMYDSYRKMSQLYKNISPFI